MTPANHFSTDELICACIARQIKDGEVVAQGIATPLVASGYLLAKHTHAPNLQFASAIGNALVREPAPIGLARVEELWLKNMMMALPFARIACEMLPRYQPTEFFRPAQVDPYGNFNNIAIGDNYHRPRFRLPGCGGIGDVTVYGERIYLYVPRHSKVVFVPKVDFVSGLGHSPARRAGAGPRYLVSDLGQFDFTEGRLRLTTIHPGVTIEKVERRTGFELQIAPDLRETPHPTADEIHLLRQVIDPLGIRRLETASGSQRKLLIRDILTAEGCPPASR
jgi:acyl CoA:acetate/3-ketoacid CoA transferase beta subunit